MAIQVDLAYTKRKRTLQKAVFLCFRLLSYGMALLLFYILGFILIKGASVINWDFLTQSPADGMTSGGIWPAIVGTFYLMIGSAVFAFPVGVMSGIYMSEYAPQGKLVSFIRMMTNNLAGIPSIIYGLTGMLIFCQFFSLKTSLLSGALTLVIMNLPTIIRTVQESLKTVPQGYREGAFGLGAGKWHMIRTVVLPCCIDGIVTGCILATGRMIGESAALLFTAGFAHALNGFFDALTHSGATLTVALYVYAKEQGEFEVAFVIAAILLVLSLITNMSASYVGRRFQKSKG